MTDPDPLGARRPRRRRAAEEHRGTRVTLQDVADLAGVSVTTASRVVNEGARKVGPTMAARVARAVAELGYQANLPARAVAVGYTSIDRKSVG